MILLGHCIVGVTLSSVGFVAGCFWSTNFVRERMAHNGTISGMAGTTESLQLGLSGQKYSFVMEERTSVR